jgi:hypothetical protein
MSAESVATQADSGKVRGGKQFTIMAVLVGTHAVLSFVNYKPSSSIHLVLAIIVSAWMVYFFWRRNIWARRLVLITAAVSFLVEVPTFSKLSALGQLVIGVHLVVAAFLLYRLNTKLAKAYFNPAPSKNDAQHVT